jgi:purine-nucleoside phosphorylase
LSGVARHDDAVVLGTGLADAAGALGEPTACFPFSRIPGFPAEVSAGQRAEAWSVPVGERRMLVLRGRPHLYEGWNAEDVAHPVRSAAMAGCRTVVITNAAGGIREGLVQGDLVLISDHLNLTALSPLGGSRSSEAERETVSPSPFVDLTDAWSPRLRATSREVAAPALEEGVYAQLPGPHFETPAEIRMLRAMGADLVGMSSVLEAIAARHLGVEVLGISVVTNVAAGLGDGAVHPTSVAAVAHESAVAVGTLVREVLLRS